MHTNHTYIHTSEDTALLLFLSLSSLLLLLLLLFSVFRLVPHLTFHHIMVINHVEIKWKRKKRTANTMIYTHTNDTTRTHTQKWFITTIKTKINYIFDEHEPMCVHFVTIFLILPFSLFINIFYISLYLTLDFIWPSACTTNECVRRHAGKLNVVPAKCHSLWSIVKYIW